MNKGAVIKQTPLLVNERLLLKPHRFKGTPFQGYRIVLSNKYYYMFISREFKVAWDDWKKHKQEKGNPYTPTSENRALSVLFKESHGIEDLAIQSINYSLENNWNKIYILQNYNNGTGKTSANNGQSNFRDSVKDELDKRYGNREQAAN